MGLLPLVGYENWALTAKGSTFAASPEHSSFPATNLGTGVPQQRAKLTGLSGYFDVTLPFAGLSLECAVLDLCSFGANSVVTAASYSDAGRTSIIYGPEEMTDRGDAQLWWLKFASRQDARYWRFAVSVVLTEEEDVLLDTEEPVDSTAAIGEIYLGPIVEIGQMIANDLYRRASTIQQITQRTPSGVVWPYPLSDVYKTFQIGWHGADSATREQLIALQRYVQGSARPWFLAPAGTAWAEAYYVRLMGDIDLNYIVVNQDEIALALQEEPMPLEV